jgi:ribosomal protein S27AE
MANRCYRCGGEMLATGALFSAVRTSFRPQDSKFLTLATGDVMTKATMCRKCGVIEIIGDVNKLRHLTPEPESSPEPETFTLPDPEELAS